LWSVVLATVLFAFVVEWWTVAGRRHLS
jgi:hypothetical protein